MKKIRRIIRLRKLLYPRYKAFLYDPKISLLQNEINVFNLHYRYCDENERWFFLSIIKKVHLIEGESKPLCIFDKFDFSERKVIYKSLFYRKCMLEFGKDYSRQYLKEILEKQQIYGLFVRVFRVTFLKVIFWRFAKKLGLKS